MHHEIILDTKASASLSRDTTRILHLEDTPRDAEMLRDLFESHLQCELIQVHDRDAFERAVRQARLDLIISDFHLPTYDGLSALRFAKQEQPHTPVIMLSGALTAEDAVTCMQAGADDYVLKQRSERLLLAVKRALEHAAERRNRHRAEAELQAARARLEHVLSNTSAVIYSCAATGDHPVTFVSDNILTQSGHSPQQFIQDPAFWLSCVHPSDKQIKLEGSHQGLTAGWHIHEYRLRHQDQSYHWYRDELRLVRNAEGVASELVGCMINIDLRKKSELLLRQEKFFSDNVIKNVSGLFFVLNEQGYFVRSNENLQAHLGIPFHEMQKHLAVLVFHEADRKAVSDMMAKVFLSGQAETEARIHAQAGIKHVRLAGRRLVLNGKPYLIGSGIDISERKQVEAQRELLAELIRQSRDFISMVTFEGRVSFINPAGQQLIGFDKNSGTQDLTVTDLFGKAELEHYQAQVLPAVLQSRHWTGETRVRNMRNQRRVPVEMSCFSVCEPTTGKAYAIAIIMRDVAERNRVGEWLVMGD